MWCIAINSGQSSYWFTATVGYFSNRSGGMAICRLTALVQQFLGHLFEGFAERACPKSLSSSYTLNIGCIGRLY